MVLILARGQVPDHHAPEAIVQRRKAKKTRHARNCHCAHSYCVFVSHFRNSKSAVVVLRTSRHELQTFGARTRAGATTSQEMHLFLTPPSLAEPFTSGLKGRELASNNIEGRRSTFSSHDCRSKCHERHRQWNDASRPSGSGHTSTTDRAVRESAEVPWACNPCSLSATRSKVR